MGSISCASLELARLVILRAMASFPYLAASYSTVRPLKGARQAAVTTTCRQRGIEQDCRLHFECNDPLLRCFEISERAKLLQRKNREFRQELYLKLLFVQCYNKCI